MASQSNFPATRVIMKGITMNGKLIDGSLVKVSHTAARRAWSLCKVDADSRACIDFRCRLVIGAKILKALNDSLGFIGARAEISKASICDIMTAGRVNRIR